MNFSSHETSNFHYKHAVIFSHSYGQTIMNAFLNNKFYEMPSAHLKSFSALKDWTSATL